MEENRNAQDMDFDMEQMLQMAKWMQEMMQPSEEGKQEGQDIFNPLDEYIQTPQIKALYAALPHLDRQQQKMAGLLAKMVEMQNLLRYYEQPSIQSKTAGDPMKALSAIRPYLPESKQKMVDLFVQFSQMQSMLQQYQMLQNIMKEA